MAYRCMSAIRLHLQQALLATTCSALRQVCACILVQPCKSMLTWNRLMPEADTVLILINTAISRMAGVCGSNASDRLFDGMQYVPQPE